jgi:hypothetical protein|eukprot:COSAG02_NODE_10294_length_1976_cov_1.709110_2_plen_115_part_00
MKIALYSAGNEGTNTVNKCAEQCATTSGCGHFNFGVADRAGECRLYYATHECDYTMNSDWVYYRMITVLNCVEAASGYFIEDGVAHRCTGDNAWYRCPAEVSKHRPAAQGGVGP